MRTMVCICREGYTGKGDQRCDKIVAPIEIGCSSDYECPITQACENRKCLNPCSNNNPCAPIATCIAQNHKATCRCPEGFNGDPYRQCQPIDTGCKSDSECQNTEACQNGQCLNPCVYPNDPCGQGAQCQPINHAAVCSCPVGWAGNPHTQCYQYECLTNNDCPYDKACQNQECVNPCLTTSCGSNAICEVEYHQSRCICSPGLQGNPLVSCTEVGCRSDNDCNDREKCNHQTQSCEPLCQRSPCARSATCEAKNHRENCICPPPLQGDGFAFCTSPSKTHESIKIFFYLTSCFIF